jgi:hypothetical protein
MWTPPQALGDPPLLALLRARLVNALIAIPVLLLVPAAFLSALFLHIESLAAVGMALLAAYCASRAVVEAFVIRWVLHGGRWTGFKGDPIWRDERPVRYWAHTAVHATVLATLAAGAVLLT